MEPVLWVVLFVNCTFPLPAQWAVSTITFSRGKNNWVRFICGVVVIDPSPMQPLRHSFKPAIGTGSPALCTFVNPISYERNRAVRAGRIAGGIVAGHGAEKSNLVASLICIFALAPALPLAVSFVTSPLFYVVIDIGPS